MRYFRSPDQVGMLLYAFAKAMVVQKLLFHYSAESRSLDLHTLRYDSLSKRS